MANNHIKSDIPAYLSGQVSETRRRDIEAHIATCDDCRNALNKAKGKQARLKRQALKTAMPDKVPNLLLTRLGKDAGVEAPSSRRGWLWFGGFFLLLGVSYGIARYRGQIHPSGERPLSSGATSTTTPKMAEPFEVQVSCTSAGTEKTAAAEVTTESASSQASAPQQWMGEESSIKDYREVVVRSRSAWIELWMSMGQAGQAPRVNFNEWIIVGIFAGEKVSGGYQVVLETPKELEDHFQVPYRVTAPAQSTQQITHPYTLMTIPRVQKRVRFQIQ